MYRNILLSKIKLKLSNLIQKSVILKNYNDKYVFKKKNVVYYNDFKSCK